MNSYMWLEILETLDILTNEMLAMETDELVPPMARHDGHGNGETQFLQLRFPTNQSQKPVKAAREMIGFELNRSCLEALVNSSTPTVSKSSVMRLIPIPVLSALTQ